MPEDLDQYFRDMGAYFGYPSCCVQEFVDFVKHLDSGKHIDRGLRKLTGTGYVPCVKCNEKSEQDLLSEIAKNRAHPEPFPLDLQDRRLDEFLKSRNRYV